MRISSMQARKSLRFPSRPVRKESTSSDKVALSEDGSAVRSEALNPKVKSFKPNHTEVYKSAFRLCSAMAALNIPCAIAGGLAVVAHGYQRSTRDVDVILSPDGLAKFQEKGHGRGWMERYKGARNMRDTTNDVGVDVILTTDRPVNVPSPSETVANSDGLPVLPLPRLIELKLSTANDKRKKDTRDVAGLIRVNDLGPEYAQYLDPSVRAQFLELCRAN